MYYGPFKVLKSKIEALLFEYRIFEKNVYRKLLGPFENANAARQNRHRVSKIHFFPKNLAWNFKG